MAPDGPDVDAAVPAFGDGFRRDLEALLRWRRDVRRFRPDPLAPGLLERLIGQAGLAPSVGLSQPARFVLVEAPWRRAAVQASFEACNARALAGQPSGRASLYARLKLAGLETAPCQLAVFAEPDPVEGGGLGRATMPETVAWSAVIAVHTLWLAARAANVGLGWVSILDPVAVASCLDVPSHWRFVGYLCLGTPAVEDDVPALERAGWERRRVEAPLLRR